MSVGRGVAVGTKKAESLRFGSHPAECVIEAFYSGSAHPAWVVCRAVFMLRYAQSDKLAE